MTGNLTMFVPKFQISRVTDKFYMKSRSPANHKVIPAKDIQDLLHHSLLVSVRREDLMVLGIGRREITAEFRTSSFYTGAPSR